MKPEDYIKQIVDEDGGHSWFSPSASDRLLRCPASFMASAGLPDSSNAVADQGTACHLYMEKAYQGATPEELQLVADTFETEWQMPAVHDAIVQVNALMARMQELGGCDEVHLERVYNLSSIFCADVYGTTDVTLYGVTAKHLVILDYKFGMGEVYPEGSDQLMTYGFAALSEFPDAERVSLIVCQPRRAKSLREYEMTAGVLKAWGKDTLFKGIKLCASEEGATMFVPGEIQCKWCRNGREGCTAQQDWLIGATDVINDSVSALSCAGEIVLADKVDLVHSLSNERVSEILTMLPYLKSCIKQVTDIATDRAHNGEIIEGFKPVRKIGNRAWIDEDKASAYIGRKGIKVADRMTKKLISPAAAEELIDLDNTQMRNAFDKLWKRPDRGKDIAPMTDKRKAVTFEPQVEVEVKPDVVTLESIF